MLNLRQIEQYRSEGFLVLQDFFSEDALQVIDADIDALVDRLAVKLYERGKLKNLHRDKG